MKKILIDLQCLQTESAYRGIGRFVYNLTLHMLQQSDGLDFHILLNAALPKVDIVKQKFIYLIDAQKFHVFTPISPCSSVNPDRWQNMEISEFMYETFVASINPDVLFLPSLMEGGFHDELIVSVSKYFNITTVVVCYDLIPLHYESHYLANDAIRRHYFNRLQHVSNAKAVLCISEFVTNEIKCYLNKHCCYNISTGRVELFESNDCLSTPEKFLDLKNYKYILYTGGTDFRKNINGLIESYSNLESGLKCKYYLVIVGSIPDSEVEIIRDKCSKFSIIDKCHVFTYVSDLELMWLYRNCSLFVFPSFDEGFGLPVLEAMQCGAVTCCGNNSSLVEVAGLEEMLFNAQSHESMTAKMAELLLNEELRSKIIKHAKEHIHKFNWNSTATKALEAIKSTSCGDGANHSIILKPRLLVYIESRLSIRVNQLLRRLNTYFSLVIISKNEYIIESFSEGYKYIIANNSSEIQYNYEYCAVLFDDYGQLLRLIVDKPNLNLRLLIDMSESYSYDICQDIITTCLGIKVLSFDCLADKHISSVCNNARMQLDSFNIHNYVTVNDAFKTAYALSKNTVRIDVPTVYIDITSLTKVDSNTGIQRVEKIILQELFNCYKSYRIVPIRWEGDGDFYIALAFINKLLNVEKYDNIINDSKLIDFARNSFFIGMDLHFDFLFDGRAVSFLRKQKIYGTKLYNIQYDLIPVNTMYADKGMSDHFHNNMILCASLFDGSIAISQSVADEYISWFRGNQIKVESYKVGYFHLGCDIDKYNSHHNTDTIEDLSILDNKKFMLMVSTIEPRKGHAQVLEAFEELWQNDSDYCLVFVGKKGWNIDSLIDKVNNHPQLNKKLIWLQGISDQVLTKVYEMATSFIMASYAEGFGLGIVESAKYHKPLILRDIPVFREIAEDHAYYFDCITGKELADKLTEWICLYESGKAPSSISLKTITWEESCNQLMDVIVNNNWYKTVN